MTKKEALQQVAKDINTCKECQQGTTGKAVPGEGSPDAFVVFVGEAPGKQEALTGRPFVGRSGKLLREEIRSIGLSEQEVFITSVGKYLPLQGTPSASQITHNRQHLLQQITIIQPKVVILLGSVAAQGVLGEKVSVTSLHGTIREKNGTFYFLTIHPAAALRFPPLKKLFTEDFQKLRTFLVSQKLLS